MSHLLTSIQDANQLVYQTSKWSPHALEIEFHRTLRFDTEKQTPCGLGTFTLFESRIYDKAPALWRTENHTFIPMHKFEALYLYVKAKKHEKAVKVLVNGVNVVTGQTDTSGQLHENDYIVPDAVIDFISEKKQLLPPTEVPKSWSFLNLFSSPTVTKPSIESTVIEIQVFDTPDQPSEDVCEKLDHIRMCSMPCPTFSDEEKLVTTIDWVEPRYLPKKEERESNDLYSLEHWNCTDYKSHFVHLINDQMFEYITGRKINKSMITQETYEKYAIPSSSLF
jgi:hypothetical protein